MINKEYLEPEFKVVKVDGEDVITTSFAGLATAFTDWETRTRTFFGFD